VLKLPVTLRNFSLSAELIHKQLTSSVDKFLHKKIKIRIFEVENQTSAY